MTEAEEEWAAELARDEGRPALATIISSVILLLSTCGRPDRAVTSGPEAIGYVAGGIAVTIALFWGIPYWLTIRKASRGWKVGTFVVIAPLAILTNLWAVGNSNRRFQEGLKDQDRQTKEFAEGRRTRFEAGSDANLLQRTMAELGNRNIADIQSYHSALMAAGAERISMQILRQDSPDLRNCERFAGFAARARSNRGNLDVYVADARQKLDPEVSTGTLPREAVDGFLHGAEAGKPAFERTWELQAQYAEAVGALCGILARKNWLAQHGKAAFTSEVDLAAANAQFANIQKIAAEQERMKSATLTKMRQTSL
ncbi:MAG TPA: hypothetical protein VKC17_10345 [Sphingomicrobium sp.]|nr:hypothetical protein [Sphingomicrobium sp.]